MYLLLELFLTFVKIGLFTFGGGYAMISLIEDICVEKKRWITHEEMMTVTVIAESTPGPIAVNCATYVGYQQAGTAGALSATLGVVLPSFVVIYSISMFLDLFLEIEVVASAFKGIKIAVGILILHAAVTMIRKMQKTPFSLAVMIFSFVSMIFIDLFSLDFSSMELMLLAGAAGVLVRGIRGISRKKGGMGS